MRVRFGLGRRDRNVIRGAGRRGRPASFGKGSDTMTWGETKLAALQKMFAAEGDEVREDESTREYLLAMPYAANEGMLLLCDARPLRRCVTIVRETGTSPECYDLEQLAADFCSADGAEVYFADSRAAVPDAWISAGSWLHLPQTAVGALEAWYTAYPPRVAPDTPDDEELPLAPDAAALLPLYIASELYKDDDNAIATMYRNEFELARETLRPRGGGEQREAWQSVSGWC